MAPEGSAATVVLVGARKVLPSDVLLVAVHGARIDLNQAALEKACPRTSQASSEGDASYDARCNRNPNCVAVRLPSLRKILSWDTRL